jgi:hypothetical protein
MISTTGTLQHLNDAVVLPIADLSSVLLYLSGTATGTVEPELSMDGGTTWTEGTWTSVSTGNNIARIDASLADPGPWQLKSVSAWTHARARFSVASSGSLAVRINAGGATAMTS